MAESRDHSTTGASGRRSNGLRIASVLCWIWGIIVALLGMGALIPEVSVEGSELIAVLAFLLCGVAYGAAGYLLSGKRQIGGWIAVFTAALFSVLQFLQHRGLTGPVALGLAMNLAIVIPVLANWRDLATSRREVGP